MIPQPINDINQGPIKKSGSLNFNPNKLSSLRLANFEPIKPASVTVNKPPSVSITRSAAAAAAVEKFESLGGSKTLPPALADPTRSLRSRKALDSNVFLTPCCRDDRRRTSSNGGDLSDCEGQNSPSSCTVSGNEMGEKKMASSSSLFNFSTDSKAQVFMFI